MILAITQKHINCGVQGDCHRCPIALALSEKLDLPFARINVAHNVIVEPRSGPRLYSNLGQSALTFINRFDCGISVQPSYFTIDLKEPRDVRRRRA